MNSLVASRPLVQSHACAAVCHAARVAASCAARCAAEYRGFATPSSRGDSSNDVGSNSRVWCTTTNTSTSSSRSTSRSRSSNTLAASNSITTSSRQSSGREASSSSSSTSSSSNNRSNSTRFRSGRGVTGRKTRESERLESASDATSSRSTSPSHGSTFFSSRSTSPSSGSRTSRSTSLPPQDPSASPSPRPPPAFPLFSSPLPATLPPPPLLSSLLSRQQEQISLYLDILLDWNQRMNLTAILSRKEAEQRHIADALSLLPVISAIAAPFLLDMSAAAPSSAVATPPPGPPGALRLVDVGTGAGLPGIVLAVAQPRLLQVTLVESLRKRCDFLQHVVKEMGLRNVEIVWGRAEEVAQHPDHREAYDMAVARAVAEMRVLAELCVPLVRVGGAFIAAKGPNPQVILQVIPQEEVEAAAGAASLLGAELAQTYEVQSSTANGSRTAVVYRKTAPTPSKHPRVSLHAAPPVAIATVQSSTTNGSRTAVVYRKAAPTPTKYPRRPGMPSKRPL